MNKEKKAKIELEVPAYFSERGNNLIVNSIDGSMNAWFNIGKDKWIEFSWRPDNYPSMYISIRHILENNLARHINSTFNDDDWVVSKMNINGVIVDENNHITLSRDFSELLDWQVETIKQSFLTSKETTEEKKKNPTDDDLYKYLKKNIDKFTLLFQKEREDSEEDRYTAIWLYTFNGDQIAFKQWLNMGEPPAESIVYAMNGEEFQEYCYTWGSKVKNDMPIGIEKGEKIELFSNIRYN
jgi:hypothetical protein